jgi:hypothetical protein
MAVNTVMVAVAAAAAVTVATAAANVVSVQKASVHRLRCCGMAAQACWLV